MNTKFLAAITIAAAASLAASAEAATAPLTLFGVPLQGATRTQLRQALSKAGLSPIRVDEHYFCDKYAVRGQLAGASQLEVCYTQGDRFALAEYTFPGFMDTALVKRVIDTVATKYGRPGFLSGDFNLGNVTAEWNEAGGMRIRVARGWPDTTTFLDLEDPAAERRMKAQAESAQHERQQQQARHDSKAF